MSEEITESQVASWYHSKILRIPHGDQNPSKRYLSEERILELFDGRVVIQEKVDGKMGWSVDNGKAGRIIRIHEDMTRKHTPHDHVMKYGRLPANKRIHLESIYVPHDGSLPYIACCRNVLTYADMKLSEPTIETIYNVLETFSLSPSHFGSPAIEGLVVKNYSDGKNVLFGKWDNDSFEEAL